MAGCCWIPLPTCGLLGVLAPDRASITRQSLLFRDFIRSACPSFQFHRLSELLIDLLQQGEVYHYLRDKGFLIKVPASWREVHARGQKLLRLGTAAADLPERLGVSQERWGEIVLACSQRVVAVEADEQQLQ